MTESRTCVHCGASLDDKVDHILPNGVERGVCPGCERPYEIPESQVAEPDPDPDPDLGPDPDPEE